VRGAAAIPAARSVSEVRSCRSSGSPQSYLSRARSISQTTYDFIPNFLTFTKCPLIRTTWYRITAKRPGNFLNKHKMETVLLQINNNKAYRLLEDLEDLHIIKVLKKSIQPQQKLSEKYAGKLPSDIADELQDYVTQSRNECNNRSI
jgi:hypothetical protein